jgi:ABC-type phosphate/phosphonate transport system substrate-binding protein
MSEASIVRFAFATTPQMGDAAASEMSAMFAAAGIALEPVFVRDYAALYDAVHLHEVDCAWAPPLVARDLSRDGAADPCVTVLHRGGANYFSAIVGTGSLRTPADVTRIGWVSRLSAAGYLVPRAYLKSIGIPVDGREERFFHTHARSMEALRMGIVDAIATYATRDDEDSAPRVPHAFEGARVLTTIGPIPGDVIVCTRTLAANVTKRVTDVFRSTKVGPRAAIATLMGATGFGEVPPHHLDALTRWVARPMFSSRPSMNEMHGA